jgi:VanZ family protein
LNNSHNLIPPETRAQFWIRWTFTLAWAGTIFLFSTGTFVGSFTEMLLQYILHFLHLRVTLPTFLLLHHLFRKAGHVTEYFIFGMFLYHCFLNSNRTEWRARTAVWAVMGAGLYSLTDELHQRFVPGRGPSLRDCGIDTMGAALAMLFIFIWTRFNGSTLQATTGREDLPSVST